MMVFPKVIFENFPRNCVGSDAKLQICQPRCGNIASQYNDSYSSSWTNWQGGSSDVWQMFCFCQTQNPLDKSKAMMITPADATIQLMITSSLSHIYVTNNARQELAVIQGLY